VLPQVGQIWAIYMNWAPDWVTSSSNACEFVVGLIIACTEAGTTLMLLTQVRGYRCVFKSDKKKDFDLMIPSGENLGLFSNHISFCLTKERSGTLQGFYELDPLSLPDVFLSDDT